MELSPEVCGEGCLNASFRMHFSQGAAKFGEALGTLALKFGAFGEYPDDSQLQAAESGKGGSSRQMHSLIMETGLCSCRQPNACINFHRLVFDGNSSPRGITPYRESRLQESSRASNHNPIRLLVVYTVLCALSSGQQKPCWQCHRVRWNSDSGVLAKLPKNNQVGAVHESKASNYNSIRYPSAQ